MADLKGDGGAAGGRDGGRDRDPTGRARQARPRDALGRPLPYGAIGVEPVVERFRTAEEAVAEARALVAQGRHFAAHEVLEGRWKDGPDAERDLWQGLAQVCVGLTHAARGNPVGAHRLLERGVGRLTRYQATAGPTYGLDLLTVISWARSRGTGSCPTGSQPEVPQKRGDPGATPGGPPGL